MESSASSTRSKDFNPTPESEASTVPITRQASRHNAAPNDLEKAQLENERSPSPADSNVRQIRGFKWFLVCVSLYISALIYGLDTTIAADVQGDIVATFGHVEQLAWIGAGFPLGSVSVILLLGSLYGSFNMKWVYVASVVIFELGSLLCGAAPNMNAMIVGRVIAGFGGSGIYLGCLNYFSQLTNQESRGTYISLIGLCWGVGCVLGPVIGGAFAVSAATWRWAFYINLVICAVTAPIILFFLPSLHPTEGKSIVSRVKALDFLGFLLGAGIWVTFTLVLTLAGGQWGWNDGRTITVFVVFGAILVTYILQQRFSFLTTPEHRSFPVPLLSSRTHVLLVIASAANVTSVFVVMYFLPIYFQFVHGDSALTAAIRLLPFVAVSVVVNLAIGHGLPRLGYYMPVYLVSGVLVLIGGAILTISLDPSTPQARIYGLSVVVAAGAGLTMQTSYAVAGARPRAGGIGPTIALQNVAQIGGIVIALVIAGQVFQSSAVQNLAAALASAGLDEQQLHSVVAGTQSELFAELSPELKVAAVLAITQAIQKSFILVIVSGATLIVSAAAMKIERLFITPIAAM